MSRHLAPHNFNAKEGRMSNSRNLTLSRHQRIIFDAMMNGENVAMFGDAGSGKSVLVRQFLTAKSGSGDVVCLTPTGLAARNIGEAQTIHSFFSIDPGCVGNPPPLNRRLCSILPHIKTILIDEISMVRSDIFDVMEDCLRRVPLNNCSQPFGGRQIIVVGDFKQLPPVVSDDHIAEYLEYQYSGEYAFQSRAWQMAEFKYYHLTGSFRQTSDDYYDLLQCIRNNQDTMEAIHIFNQKVVPITPAFNMFENSKTMALCSRRVDANNINRTFMANLHGSEFPFQALVKGKFPMNEYPTDQTLKLKEGAKVMLLANKKANIQLANHEFEYVNGDIGKIVNINNDTIIVQLEENKFVTVQPNVWNCYEYELIEEEGEKRVMAKNVGSFCQFPIAIAYASTIHKAQGQTLDSIYVVLGKGCFAPGQLYTALSRVRSLDCLYLASGLQFTDVIADRLVDEFYTTQNWEPFC